VLPVAPLGEQRQHLALAPSKVSSSGSSTRRAAIAGGDQLLNQDGVDDRGSIADPLERLEELVDTVTRAFNR
jgi:hypothetical protein